MLPLNDVHQSFPIETIDEQRGEFDNGGVHMLRMCTIFSIAHGIMEHACFSSIEGLCIRPCGPQGPAASKRSRV